MTRRDLLPASIDSKPVELCGEPTFANARISVDVPDNNFICSLELVDDARELANVVVAVNEDTPRVKASVVLVETTTRIAHAI